MSEPKRPLKVFLCHAHADRDPVRALYTRLTADGVDAWLDKEKLLPGQDWELEIRKAVREADVVVVCLSKQFNQAGFRQKEVRLALDTAMEELEGEIFIIPARLEECEVPERLRRFHWVDLFADGGYEKLSQSLNLRYEQIEKARIEKEEAVKRRLPFFQTPNARNNVMQKSVRTSSENMSLPETAPPESAGQPSHKKSKTQRSIKTEYIVAIIGAVATIVAGILGSPLIENMFFPAVLSSENLTATSTVNNSITPTSTIPDVTVTNNMLQNLGVEKIVFTSDMDCVSSSLCQNLYIINMDGSEQKNLTINSPAPYNYNPEISPDGKQLLFTGGYPADSDDLFMIDLSTSNIEFVTELSGAPRGTSGLSWSVVDDESVVYDVYVDNNIRNVIELFNLRTKVTIRLTKYNEDDNYPSWSFDGRKIAFMSGNGSADGLFTMNPDGTERQLLYDDIRCLGPKFSPVNLEVVMYCDKYGSDLFIFDVISKKLTPITNFPSDERSPSWSPDGEWIVFQSNMDDPNYQTCSPKDGDIPCNNEIYIIRSNGSNLTRLTFNNADDGDPVWGR